ncbi:MAG: ribosomal protection-like ABC-F family protein [Traorella sp.]
MKYQINKGSKGFGGVSLFENIQFEIRNNEKIAIIGNNGCGKTTLLRIIAKEEELDSGVIHQANDVKIGYLAQTTFSNEENSVQEEMNTVFKEVLDIKNQLEKIYKKMEYDHSETLLNDYARLQHAFEDKGGYTIQSSIETIFTKFGFKEEDLTRQIKTFSGGQRTRIAFVKLLLSAPDILLLDEPTNHLDLETIEWLEGYVKRYPKAVVLVSHDRTFINNVADEIYEIEFGVMRHFVGNYDQYIIAKESDIERQKSAYARQQKEIERIEALIEKFRYKKNKAAFAQSKIKYLERMEKVEDVSAPPKTFKAHFQSRIRGGNRVLEVRNLAIGYDHVLCKVSFEIMQKERIAIIGPNGKGKSTLVKTIMGIVPPLGGEMLLGHQIEIGYFDQDLAQFNKSNTVLEEVWNEYPNMTRSEVRTALGCFLFSGDDVFKTIDCLSGGEKVRLSLVKLMLKQPNFLIMDEPTNHLDLAGKEALEKSLREYDGTMLVVSHDRYFINKIATSILYIDENGAVFYRMNYQDYLDRNKTIEPSSKPSKENKKEKAIPERKSINYSREIKKLEKQIDQKETEIEQLRELRFEPEYYHDYQKMAELNDKIDEVNNEIENMMAKWEEYSECLENGE